MPDSLIDLSGLRVGVVDFLAAVLEAVAQPVWVVDPDGVIRFANPAAISALGYDSAEQLLGCASHETIHYRHPDGTPYPAAECPMLLPRTTGETIRSDLDWFLRRDGSMFAVSYVSVPIDMPEGRGAVVAFTDIDERRKAEQAMREHEAALAAEQASLRRVAALVAGGAASREVFAAIAREVGQVIGLPLVALWRFGADGKATVIGEWGEHPHPFRAGTRWPLDGPTICARVLQSGRPERIDDFAGIPGAIADAARTTGIRSCAGAPIVVDGRIWGAMSVDSTDGAPLAEGTERRLAGFTELVATAISNTAGREQLVRLADEQAALRRVATLVAQEPASDDVFAAVAGELGRFPGIMATRLVRYEDDGTVTVVASWGRLADVMPVGTRLPLGGTNVMSMVARTGRPARIDDYTQASGVIAGYGRRLDARGVVGGPIVVGGRVWGAMIATSSPTEPLPAGTETWIEAFAQLAATAISNIQAREDLAASRARIVVTADEERRRVVRDLHDGAQQRLVHTVVTLKLAQRSLRRGDAGASELVAQALEHAEQATAELRELSHGILPSVLTRGGLRAGVDALASRMAIPVSNGVTVGRLPASVEATAYFVVAEALTNVAKHAHAERASIAASERDGVLRIAVRDDGVGGARPAGIGLVGLADRVAALAGRLRVDSPPGGGTLVEAEIPIG